jgi:hypothetical protein
MLPDSTVSADAVGVPSITSDPIPGRMTFGSVVHEGTVGP